MAKIPFIYETDSYVPDWDNKESITLVSENEYKYNVDRVGLIVCYLRTSTCRVIRLQFNGFLNFNYSYNSSGNTWFTTYVFLPVKPTDYIQHFTTTGGMNGTFSPAALALVEDACLYFVPATTLQKAMVYTDEQIDNIFDALERRLTALENNTGNLGEDPLSSHNEDPTAHNGFAQKADTDSVNALSVRFTSLVERLEALENENTGE